MEEQSQQTCSPSDTTHLRETRRASEMDLYRLSGGSMLAITFFCWRRRWSEGFQACHIVDHASACQLLPCRLLPAGRGWTPHTTGDPSACGDKTSMHGGSLVLYVFFLSSSLFFFFSVASKTLSMATTRQGNESQPQNSTCHVH